MYYSKIVGHGRYLPEKILTNEMLEQMVDTSDEWIIGRTGIRERHIAGENEFTSDLALRAAQNALINANLAAEDLDLIVVTTATPDMLTPSVACIVQGKLGAKNAAAFDLAAACSGFLYGLSAADAFIKSGMYQTVMVIGAETLSRVTDYQDRNTCVLFGDGAGAVILRRTEEKTGVLKTSLGSDGASGMLLTIPVFNIPPSEIEKRVTKSQPTTIWMDGHEVYRFAVKIMADETQNILSSLDMTVDDIDLLIPHQANIRIVSSATKRLKIDPEKVYINLQDVGNISAACIPVALSEALEKGIAKKGDRVCMVGFGGGLTWASAVIEI